MKSFAVLAAVLALVCCPQSVGAARMLASRASATPVDRVVGLITSLEARIQGDGRAEQQSYDKYACWSEETLGRKANDISAAKEQIESAQTKIVELKSQIASHAEEIKNVEADIKANAESQRDATEVRNKERMDYNDKKTEAEQCIGALEAAITVLTGAGAKKPGNFLENLQEAKVLSVAAGIRGVIAHARASGVASEQDLKIVRQFADRPEDFMGGRTGGLSAVQIAQNPFGDYAPQSTQIQGILKGMYDTFVSEMEKANAEEAEAQKAFEELMATKRAEMQTLQLTLDKQNLDKAEKTKDLADTQQLKDDTEAQLAADTVFFEQTKAAFKTKAAEWSERSRLRTEELSGLRKAVEILSSPEAQATFVNSTAGRAAANFLQVSRSRASAYDRLRSLARRQHSSSLAELAAQVRAGGHFDEVIASVDQMIALLRKEEQDDIEHRDRCQRGEKKNANDIEDLNSAIDKTDKALGRMGEKQRELVGEINTLEAQINQTKEEIATALKLRNEERTAFQWALSDDADAIELISQAILAMSRFYTRNKIPLSLARKEPPTYSMDEDKAPETIWSGANYGGRKSESTGILHILEMLKEDLTKEMETARMDDAAAQADYEKNRAAARQMLGAQTATKTATEKELAQLEAKMFDTEEFKGQKSSDLSSEQELKTSIYNDCSWVSTHFDSRRQKRKVEIDGLVEAKSYLAGVEKGDELAP
mmetsp:Transcript_62995/g.198965  ORF Transcript_62995/g.198965 Transcript_62995/m.198965 type:complete len:711 (-) Transcript_62995:127-2259(-)